MDVLTSAADAILCREDLDIILTPPKNSRIFRNLTNTIEEASFPPNSSISALLNEKIAKRTPGKRKRGKFGNENEAPSPKTPKSTMMKKESASPLTPMSNLKMLTRIASMEDPLPSKKSLFHPPKAKKSLRRCYSANETLAQTSEPTEKLKLKRHSTFSDLQSKSQLKGSKNAIICTGEVSRRDKSLGLLCERFFEFFPIEVSCLETPRRLVIDDVASLLGTERRRVYDIINVLECLNMASRVQKNMYVWMGNQHLNTTLSRLKALALRWKVGVQHTTSIDQSIKDYKYKIGNGKSSDCAGKCESRKDKSLGVLCQKFLMLFLTSSMPHIIPLDTALQLLLGKEGEDFEKLRTRGRRIYDIANVLISLNLMIKIPHIKSFKYIGPSVEATELKEDLDSDNQVRLRHSLLPPLFSDFLKSSSRSFIDSESVITPSDVVVPVSKKGKPRKLATEFTTSTMRNSNLKASTSFENILQVKPLKRHSSLSDVRQSSPLEPNLINQRSPVEAKLASPLNLKFQNGVPTQFLNLNRFQSPRVALTFNEASSSPPMLTNRPPTVPMISLQNRLYYQKVDSGVEVKRKPVVIIQRSCAPNSSNLCRSTSSPSSSSVPNLQKLHTTNGIFKVYTRPLTSGGGQSSPNYPVQVIKTVNSASNVTKSGHTLTMKSVSTGQLPTISFNTLSKSHYKTILGSDSNSPLGSLPSFPAKSFRLVINNSSGLKTATVTKSSGPTKIVSPEETSPDGELESIFGDSFKFTRPKNIVHRH